MKVTKENNILRVCVPYSLQHLPSGILLGYKNSSGDFICALDVVSDYSKYWSELRNYRQQCKQSSSEGGCIQIVGIWEKHSTDLDLEICEFFNESRTGLTADAFFDTNVRHRHRRQGSYDLSRMDDLSIDNQYIMLRQPAKKSLIQCTLHGCHGDNGFNNQDIIVIMYQPKDILSSYYIMDHPYVVTPNVLDDQSSGTQLLHNLAESLFLYKNPTKSLAALLKLCKTRPQIVKKDCCTKNPIMLFLTAVFAYIFYYLFGFIKQVALSTDILNNSIAKKVFMLPCVTNQIQQRHTDIKSAIKDMRGAPSQTLRGRNTFSRHLVDVVLGVLLMFIATRQQYTDIVADVVVQWAEWLGVTLTTLLHWLMGVPAGLKLNSQLDQFLGKFFVYHVELWQVYIQFLGPLLSGLLWYSVVIGGFLGLSLQLSLVYDLFSTLTLHIYCFYVYAARLYSLQVYTLSSLWRLFRGKKWNVLRQRVDSADYNLDQLALGTLLFVILLFLLPTTALYYIVFTTLRLSVLSMQGVLGYSIAFLNTMPIYTIWLYFFRRKAITDNVQLSVLTKPGEKPLVLKLNTISTSFRGMFHHDAYTTDTHTYGWSTFCKDLLTGQLIYPWIKRQKL